MKIDLEFIEKFLKILGFEKEMQNLYVKRYPKHDNYEIKIIIKSKLENSEIYYNQQRATTGQTTPQPTGYILLGDLTTSNFANSENFVVLDAVNKLLELGYKPEDIHLERKWKLGRTGKSGKADITVYDRNKQNEIFDSKIERKTFLIIECKTWGNEFEKEKRKLYKDGGQLFSYFQQDRSTKALVLYTGTFEDEQITYDNLIIKVQDDAEVTDICKKQRPKTVDLPCAYEEAPDVRTLVDVWKRIYKQYVFKHGIFEHDSKPYSLDLKPLKKKDLKPLKSSQGLFNAFSEILRHNNISDNANAFNRILSLFLCKIVDEEQTDEEELLDFQIFEKESFENVIDRLQRLYQIGMKKYLGLDDYVYFSDEEVKEIIDMYPKRTKLEELEEMFRQIKYYTNNEFAFKEVYNKKLFYQNALILSEVIELLQNYRVKYSHKNQILGDFFELLLNHGVKQSEGQFFTPLPIVRFMIISLGMEEYVDRRIKEEEKKDIKEEPIPKILDYACGAAHFLTEAIDEVNKIIKTKKIKLRNFWEERFIFGIEKDYRLARTAKIACFLNGDGSANIIFGDGLNDYDDLKLNKHKFDVLLTNPPYSVKKFKNYLEINHHYELLEHLTQNSSEIEVLFVERAKQVLKENGRAAIILPSSILSNLGIYKKTRELILKYFEIKAIAEFSSQTFIATGTNVVVLFLQRRGDWFGLDREKIAHEIYDEKKFAKNDYVVVEKLFEAYVSYRNLPLDDYKKFVFENEISDKLQNLEIFKAYKNRFDNLTEIKNLKKKKSFNLLSLQKQKDELSRLYKDKIRKIEKDKFFYFSLMFKHAKIYDDPNWYKFQKVVITRSPNNTKEQKQYLGYEFNKRRGFEGIDIYKDENGNPNTKLYDNTNYSNPTKVASYIRKNFANEPIDEIHEEVKSYLDFYFLRDLFDFEKTEFGKQINLNAKKKISNIETKYNMELLKDLVEIKSGLWKGKKTPFVKAKVLRSTNFTMNGKINLDDLAILDVEKMEFSNKKLIKGDILVEKSGGSSTQAVGRVLLFSLDNNDFSYGNFVARLRIKNKKNILPKYLFYILLNYYQKGATFFIQTGLGGIKNLNMNEYSKLKIPYPPIEIQRQIVSEIENLENEENLNNKKIENLKNDANKIVDDVFRQNFKILSLFDVAKILNGGTPKTKVTDYWNGDIPWITLEDIKGKYIFKTKRSITELGLNNSSAKLLPINTVVFSSRATIGAVAITKIELATNQGFKNFVCNKKIINEEFLYYLLKHEAKNIENLASGMKYKEISKEQISHYQIPVPDIKLQEKIIFEINSLESKIAELEQRNKQIMDEKKKVLKKYL